MRKSHPVSSLQASPAFRLATVAAAVATLFPLVAGAQEKTLDPIVVSGQQASPDGYSSSTADIGGKGAVPLKEIPQPVSVVTRERIEDQNMVRLEDLARRTTGMLVLANDQGRSSIFVRGFELDSYLVDGLASPLSSIYGSQPDLSIYDHVEVLRGPAGLYNGAGEPGGTVNLARKRALKDFAVSGSLSYGSWDAVRTEADVTGSLNADGSVRGRAVAAYQSKNTFVNVNDNENAVAYGTLEVNLSPRTTLSLSLTGANSNVTPFNGLPTTATGELIDFDRSTFIGAQWNRFKNQSTEAFAELVHRLDGGGELKGSARYVDRSVDFKYAYGGSAVRADNTVTRTAIARQYEEQSLTADVHWNQPFNWLGQRQNFIVGADYRQYDQTTLQGSSTITGSTDVFNPTYDWPEPTIALTSRTKVQPVQYGLYGTVRIKPWEPLTLIAGARLTKYENTTTNLSTGTSTKTDVDTQVTPYAGIVYDITKSWSAYTSYTSIFQPQTALDANNQVIKPREGNNIEVGLKGEHFGGKLNSQMSIYRLRDKNRAVAIPGTTYSAPSGEAEVKGFEAEISGTLMPGWELSAGYAYTQTEYLSGAAGQAGQTFSTYTPRHSVNVWTRYDFQGGLLRGAYVGGGVRGMSSFYNLSGNYRIEQDAYAVFDALLGYRFSPNVDVSLSINNLFDKEYYQRVGSTTVFNFYGEPRSFWLKTSLKF
ncbi:MAG: TonB-dependent siderophore receptor [Rhodocyclaceae bacterium]